MEGPKRCQSDSKRASAATAADALIDFFDAQYVLSGGGVRVHEPYLRLISRELPQSVRERNAKQLVWAISDQITIFSRLLGGRIYGGAASGSAELRRLRSAVEILAEYLSSGRGEVR